jgi:hypothetical protein
MLFVAGGCSVPTEPSPILPVSIPPTITAISGTAPAPAAFPIPVSVSGKYFLGDLQLTVRKPNATITQFRGEDLHRLSGSSFEVRLPLELPGTYYFTVRNGQGRSSDAFALDIEP